MSEPEPAKMSLMSKVKAFPFDLILYLNEVRLSIDWDDYAGSLAFPIGVGLTSCSLLIKTILSYYESMNSKSSNILFSSDYQEYERIKNSFLTQRNRQLIGELHQSPTITTSIIWLLNIVSSLINVIMLMNTYSIITKKRNYGLLYCQTKPKSPSVIKSSIESISYVSAAFNFIIRYLFDKETDVHDTSVEMDDQVDDGEIWQLNVWDPSKFSLYVFISLNPITLYIVHSYDVFESSLLYVILLLISVSVTLYFFIENFLDLIHDKQILYQEMFSEYNNKFVKPKTSILKKDALIDATRGPWESSILTDIRPYAFNKSKVWVTHDMKGNQVVDYGDSYYTDEYYKPQYVDVNSVNDSNRYFNQLRSDYDNLQQQNHELCKQLSRLTRNEGHHEFDTRDNFKPTDNEDDSDDDRSWYTSSTPYRGNAGQSRRPERDQRLSHQTPSFVNDYRNHHSITSRSPSPNKFFARSPSRERRNSQHSHASLNGITPSFRERSHSQTSLGRSPSPIRVIQSPSVARSRFELSHPSQGLYPSNNLFGNTPTNPLRSPSPTKYPQSQSPFKSPSPVKNPSSPKRWK